MKSLIIKLMVFSVIFLTLSIMLDYMISTGLKRTEDYRFQTWNNILESKIHSEVLIMGNSRAFSHYSPAVIDSVLHVNSYNLGIGGYPFNVQYLRYKLYEKYNPKPKLIIQNIDFLTLTHENFGHEREQIFPFVGNSYLRSQLSNFGLSNLEIYLPLYRYFGYQMAIKNGLNEYLGIKHYHSRPSFKGFKPEKGSWDGTELSKLTKIEPVMDSSVIRLFEEFLIHCKLNKIRVVLVNSPIYIGATRKLRNKEKLDALLQGLSRKYNVPYIDYTHDPICNDTAYFNVAVHLNQGGATLFSKKLADDIKAMNILN